MPYPEEPALKAAATALLGTAWRRVPPGIESALSWGADWYEVSTPFFVFDQGAPVAHVGVLEIPLRVGGRDLVVAGVHAVCVHPQQRGRGHMRTAMNAALTWVDARYDTAVLWTGEPEIYTRFGFARREEHLFLADTRRVAGRGGARALSVTDAADRQRLQDLLARRAPISDVCAARDPGWLFLIDLSLWSDATSMLRFIPELDCAAVCEVRDGALRIYDVIAASPPPLRDLVAHLADGETRIEVLVTPDRLGGEPLRPAPHPMHDVLMVRGRPLDIVDDAPFALSALSRC